MGTKDIHIGGHCGTGYQALANAIIKQAAADYEKWKMFEYRYPNKENSAAVREGKKALIFFKSRWFAQLTEIDADYLIRKLDEKIEDEIQRIEEGKKKGKKKNGTNELHQSN